MGGLAIGSGEHASLGEPTPQPRGVSVGRRPLFRGYHLAFVILAGIILLEIGAAAIVGDRIFHQSPARLFQLNDYRRTLPGWFLLPLAWIGLVTIQLVRRRIERPTRTLLRLIRYRSDWLIRGLLILAAYPAMAKSFGVLKSAIPALNSYWLDPTLVKLDIWMLGTDAWRLSHDLLPSSFMVAIDRVYILWFTYVILATGIFVFSRDPKFQIRGALTFHICWFALGICLATYWASVGPWFYDQTYGGSHFADLSAVLAKTHEDKGLVAVYAMKFLERSAGVPKLGAGISAMPSLHVSMAFFGFLLAMHYPRLRWLKIVTALFTVAIVVGSVHLGWHYLSDGLVSILLTWIIWIATGRLVDWCYRPPAGALNR